MVPVVHPGLTRMETRREGFHTMVLQAGWPENQEFCCIYKHYQTHAFTYITHTHTHIFTYTTQTFTYIHYTHTNIHIHTLHTHSHTLYTHSHTLHTYKSQIWPFNIVTERQWERWGGGGGGVENIHISTNGWL